MRLPARAPLSASVPKSGAVSKLDTARSGKGPLGALPALSAAARRALALAAGLSLLNAAALVAQAFLLAAVLAAIVDGSAGTGDELRGRLAALLAVVVVRSLVSWALRVVSARAAASAKEELRARAVDQALRLGPEWIASRGPGQLATLTTRGLDALDAYFTEYLPALVTAAVVPLGAGAAILLADWPSAVIIAATVPLLPMFAILVGSYTADRVSGSTDALHRLSGHLLELIRALPVLTAFRRAEAQAEAVRRVSDRHRVATVSSLRIAFSSAFVLELAATLSVALVAVVIGVRLVSGDLSLAIGLGVLILAPECYQPLRSVGTAFHAGQDGAEAVRRVADILDEPMPNAGTNTPRRGEVRVEGLSVRRRDRVAPDGESFVAEPGHTVWLRSRSGAGKSTTFAVLLGFVRPDSGTITIGGVPLSEVDLTAWREMVAWVPQSPAFAGGTVRAELELAVTGTLPAGAVETELTRLGIGGLVDEPVDHLSTGQRQRVAVARALLRFRHGGAWLLLLDEPVAHLDTASADLVMSAVRAAEHDGAAVVIAAHERPTADLALTPDRNLPTSSRSSPDDGNSLTNSRPVPLRKLLDRRLLAGAVLGAAALIAGVALTATSGWLIARASQQPPILTLTVAVVGVRTFGLARAGLRYVERIITHDAAFRVAGRLRVRLWRSLVRLGPAHTTALRAGEGQRTLVDDVDTVRDLLPRAVTPPLVAAVVLTAAIGVQTAVLPEAGLALAAAVLLGAFLGPTLALWVERRATSALAGGRRSVAARVLVLFDSAAELIAFGADRSRRAGLAADDSRLAAVARRQALGSGIADAVIVLVAGAATLASTALAASAVAAGRLDPVLAPLLALVPLALAEVLALLPPAAQHWNTLRTARTRLGAVSEVPQCGIGELQRSQMPRSHIRELPVALRGVDLRWPGATEPVLRDVDLEVPAGSHVAVVGPSGAGKSTLLAALLGFLDPERGEIRRPRRVAWAPQEPQLVSTTVAENLRLAAPEATDQDLAEALRTAVVADLDPATVLHSAGAGLSGGQAQRVALARALLAAPEADLVVLDEPTAHLDEPTARLLRANLRAALAGTTVVQVTHRPEEADDADIVIEVSGGRVRQLTGHTASAR
ncbi:ATP-binding cassette, subfamily C, CydD/ATP-binding cassette, subfamily C, CydCD [Amycolatopsis marina]|uniref:ATP-binding cassette, subfamily C, CydD/ATP-binding cassette, subfamily C, CydCD n=1 Tax=Amycolatopsis marina TaxID=490629 RepID=A0A1I0W7I3_9PSEU|nr:thiol reductant ABC exporter subunit CydD [Amycolatopsis marina]SFA83876.1 ATP-binding cassette, subfamily C, CydD/ATP-binding cassette, subfamily C, CydCD [Amycolatopsis marina]